MLSLRTIKKTLSVTTLKGTLSQTTLKDPTTEDSKEDPVILENLQVFSEVYDRVDGGHKFSYQNYDYARPHFHAVVN